MAARVWSDARMQPCAHATVRPRFQGFREAWAARGSERQRTASRRHDSRAFGRPGPPGAQKGHERHPGGLFPELSAGLGRQGLRKATNGFQEACFQASCGAWAARGSERQRTASRRHVSRPLGGPGPPGAQKGNEQRPSVPEMEKNIRKIILWGKKLRNTRGKGPFGAGTLRKNIRKISLRDRKWRKTEELAW